VTKADVEYAAPLAGFAREDFGARLRGDFSAITLVTVFFVVLFEVGAEGFVVVVAFLGLSCLARAAGLVFVGEENGTYWT
jgi:hypothetical protein